MTTASARSWVDDELLAGDADGVSLRLGEPVTKRELRRLVAGQERALAAAGLSAGGTGTWLPRLPGRSRS